MLRVETDGLLAGIPDIAVNVANPAGDPCADDHAGLNAALDVNAGDGSVLHVGASAVYANTEGTQQGFADAGVANLDVTIRGIAHVTATVLTSEATAGPCPSTAFTSGSQVANVGVNVLGVPVNVVVAPTISVDLRAVGLGILTIRVNETIQTSDQVTQRALRISSDLIGDVIVAEAIADVHGNPCPKTPPKLKPGFMTGGGTISGNVHHGAHLMCNAGEGHSSLEVNWGNGNRFHLTDVTSSSCSGDGARAGQPKATFNTLTGSGTGKCAGGADGNATWTLTDNGEPGTADTFTINVSGGCTLSASGTLQRGNHQAHGQV